MDARKEGVKEGVKEGGREGGREGRKVYVIGRKIQAAPKKNLRTTKSSFIVGHREIVGCLPLICLSGN